MSNFLNERCGSAAAAASLPGSAAAAAAAAATAPLRSPVKRTKIEADMKLLLEEIRVITAKIKDEVLDDALIAFQNAAIDVH